MVEDIKYGERGKTLIPFTTSTLQQEASKSIKLLNPEDHADCPAAL